MAEVTIGPLAQIPPGEGRNFEIAETMVAVFHIRGGGVCAAQAHCPHRGGPLADGLLDAGTIICPLHDRIFDLATGKGLGNDCSITVYKAEIDAAGMVKVTV
jgi:nitrite reductase (NADH) small subunit